MKNKIQIKLKSSKFIAPSPVPKYMYYVLQSIIFPLSISVVWENAKTLMVFDVSIDNNNNQAFISYTW